MKKYLDNLVKPYYLKRGKEGVLIIHGFCGSPAKLHFLKEYLVENTNYTLSIPLLSGHGTDMEEMKNVNYEDWMEDVNKAYNQLKKDCEKINVIGFSMGGLLALILASKKPVERLIAIAPAVFAKDKLAVLAPVGKYFIHYHSADKFKDTFPEEAHLYELEYDIGYYKYPVKSIEDLLKLEEITRAELPHIMCPVLIIQSVSDEMVEPASANFIIEKVGSEHREIAWLDTSRHICVLGPEKEVIHKHVVEFLKRDFTGK